MDRREIIEAFLRVAMTKFANRQEFSGLPPVDSVHQVFRKVGFVVSIIVLGHRSDLFSICVAPVTSGYSRPFFCTRQDSILLM